MIAMTRCRRLLVSLALLFFLGVVLSMPSVHWRLIGWARGDAFYRGMPTSWYARELQVNYHGFTSELNYRLGSGNRGKLVANNLAGDRDAIPVLLELLKHEDAEVRRLVMFCFMVQGASDPEVREALTIASQDTDAEVREIAASLLKRFATTDQPR